MTLLAEANPVRLEDVPQAAVRVDSILDRRPRVSRRLVLAVAVVVVAAAASLTGVFVFGGQGKRSGVEMQSDLPGPTVQRPLAGKQISLADGTAAVGPALVLPDTSLVGPSDAGPVWMSNIDPQTAVNVAVTFPRQGMFIDYSWPAPNADPAAGYGPLWRTIGRTST